MSKIIFTDLDGTLTLKDTYTKFVLQNLKFSSILQNLLPLTLMSIKYMLKMINDDEVKKTTFKIFFTGYDTQTNFDDFVAKIPWNKKVLELIKSKRDEGYKVIIVTASPDIYVKHVCEYLKYDGFIATKTQSDGRYLNGVFDGEVCNFKEKPKRIIGFMDGAILTHTICYGNSSGDYEMLKFCDESYFVKKFNIKRFQG